jgi:hypothetical protein
LVTALPILEGRFYPAPFLVPGLGWVSQPDTRTAKKPRRSLSQGFLVSVGSSFSICHNRLGLLALIGAHASNRISNDVQATFAAILMDGITANERILLIVFARGQQRPNFIANVKATVFTIRIIADLVLAILW